MGTTKRRLGTAGRSSTLVVVRRRLGLLALWAVVAVEIVVIVSSAWSLLAARGRVFSADDLPAGGPSTLIVLGAKAENDEPGTYLRSRLDVAVDLYRTGRVERILNSGNDAADAGNEVRVMRAYLEERGVPSEAIVDDPIGMNTGHTCRRAAVEYGIREALIVTQNFHIGRAVGLCRSEGIDAIGVIAPCDGCTGLSLVRNYVREAVLSRPKALLTVLRVRSASAAATGGGR